MRTELHRPVALDRIGAHGMAVEIQARPEELAPVAARLGVVALDSLHCAFKLRRVGANTIEAQGMLRAQVTETCVVSLDPFSHEIAEAFTIHFVPEGMEHDDPDPDAVDQVPFAGNMVDLGEAAVEQLALALDPYPRKPGAELMTEPGAERANPFAALSGRHRQS